MTVEGERFSIEMLRAIRVDRAGPDSRFTGRELRQTSVGQHRCGIDIHLAALQHGVDRVSADMRRVRQWLELVEE